MYDFVKIFMPCAWDFGVATSEIIKVSSRGLMTFDYGVLVKRASEEFAHLARAIKFASDELPVHVIAMGATEGYGPNRNGDGFKEAALRRYINTFVKNAKVYRHHQNQDPNKSYGVVKMAHYNDAMKRAELLLALNLNKAAALRNEGLVADKEAEKLNGGNDLAVSMACKVAYDVCSVCDNKARNRSEYCESIKAGGHCPGFGCKTGMTRVLDSGMIQHVDNPHPNFFDISHVFKPADRIAYGNVADYLSKAASSGVIPGGAEMAEMLGVSSPLWLRAQDCSPWLARQVKLAYELAKIEKEIEASVLTEHDKRAAASLAWNAQPIDLEPLGPPGSEQSALALAALARHKVAMPVKDFLRWLFAGDTEKVASVASAVAGMLPGVYNRLIASGSLESDIANNPFRPSDRLPSLALRTWAEKCAADYSLAANSVFHRASLSAIRQLAAPTFRMKGELSEKWASLASQVESLACYYALYKLAFVSVQTDELPLTAQFTVRQNYIS